ncbi:class II aldolase/adducin domain protein [Aspergillus steynii IBT 23096]|uniref:Class II aldolase/adducin domain protein n=1 Tax=Aspergillus steynii IBT 23096 TaxID=1392250 RepID=A0A2I2GKU5_9EURO|nr:class II aldolase/adducin domain protein [Aspergillus steynii IBT 23096]PLB53495.1 class II aldolase/adducin domain protein [Aspergillus steynii IBT 23096]
MSTTSTTTTTQALPHRTVVAQDSIPPAESSAAFQALARGDRNGKLKLRGIPSFADPLAKRQWVREHMAAAFRFFGRQGYGEGISGHISVRDPVLPEHFWMNPFAKHFSLMKASDLVLVDANGYVVEGGNQAVINEAGFIIHSEVHRARPDVMAVAHTHGVYGKTWSAFGKPVEMITQDACNFYGKLSVYEEHGGIALAQDEGRAIAKALGKENIAAILQNHGLITVGSTVDEAAFLFYSLDKACHSQLMAEAAAANGVAKKIIPDNVAQFTAESVQDPHNFYLEFQPEFELSVEESGGKVLQ